MTSLQGYKTPATEKTISFSAPPLCYMEVRRFDSLPPELVSRILCFLRARDMVQLQLVG